MRNSSLAPVALLAIFAFFILALYVIFGPTLTSSNTDFSVFYAKLYTRAHGISLFAINEQQQFFHARSELFLEDVSQYPPPYPPWYYLAYLPLGFLSLDMGTRAWFLCNLGLLFVGICLLTSHISAKKRLLVLSVSACFPPWIGMAVVGQLTMPLFFGICLMIYGFRKNTAMWVILGLILCLFKPHLGILPCAVGFALYLRNWREAKKLFPLTLFISLFLALFVISIWFEPGWIPLYLEGVSGLGQSHFMVKCDTCSSAVAELSRLGNLPAQGLWGLGGLLMLGALCGLMVAVLTRRRAFSEPSDALAFATLASLFFTPYARNYDYVLLLIPFAVLCGSQNTLRIFVAVFLYFSAAFVTATLERTEHGSYLWLTLIAPMIALLVFPAISKVQNIKSSEVFKTS